MSCAGVYIHVPFCRSRCSYCDFATARYDRAPAERYVRAVAGEIFRWRELDQSNDIDTIYFGGGTPSLLSPLQVRRILEAVRDRFRVLDGAEVTMEMNPSELSAEKLKNLRRLGINRASFGAQTFDDRELRRLGRTHTSQDIGRTFSQLREADFENISFDVIAGLPGQKLDGWSRNLDEALALGPEHLSLYLLEVHEGTPLADQIRRGFQPQPDDDLAAEMYGLMVERVCVAGYEHYEISNFCLPGFPSRHNTKYWTGAPYYGFGCSAHSYDGKRRRWANERDTARYLNLIESGESPVAETVELGPAQARAESIFLGLRLMRGISLSQHRARFGVDLRKQYAADVLHLSDAGLIEFNDDQMRLTSRGALLSNEVFAAFA